MSKDTVYKIDIHGNESTYIFLDNPQPCTLIISSVFNVLNSKIDYELLHSAFADNGLNLEVIPLDEISEQDIERLTSSSALNVLFLDGFSPKSLSIYNKLKNCKSSFVSFVSKKNRQFFQDMGELSSILSQVETKIFSNKDELQAALKVHSDGFLKTGIEFNEFDFNEFNGESHNFFELVQKNTDSEKFFRKEFEKFSAYISDNPGFDDISNLLANYKDSASILNPEAFELLDKKYHELNDDQKQWFIKIFYLCINSLLGRIARNESNEHCRSVLKSCVDNIKDDYSNNNKKFAELKNLGDACLVISEDMDSNEYSLKAAEVYLFALDNYPDLKNHRLKNSILNNLSISHIISNEHNHQPEPLTRAIEILSDNLSAGINSDDLELKACILANSATAYLKRAEINGVPEDYKIAIDKLLEVDSLSDQADIDLDDMSIYSQLSHAYHKLGDIEKNSEYLQSSIHYFERISEVLKKTGGNLKYGRALKSIGNAYLSLSEFEENSDFLMNAYEKLKESLNYLPGGTEKDEHLQIKSILGDLQFKLSAEQRDRGRILDAIKSYEEALLLVDREQNKEIYGSLNKKLGDSYRLDGEYEKNPESCFRAIESYEQSLLYYSKENDPQDFAIIHRNIGSSYEMLSHLEFEADYCQKAIDSYNQALLIYGVDSYPDEYYTVINNLGNAFSTLSEFENREDNCNKAIDCYKIASELYTFERFPLDYAMNQNNLGVAYSSLAGEIGNREYFKGAIKAFSEALKVYTLEDYPENYAMIQNNLGDSYFELSYLDDDSSELVKKSVQCFEESRKVFETEKNPSKFGFIMRKLAKTYKELYLQEKRSEVLQASINANTESLEYFKYDNFPEEYALIQIELGALYATDTKDGINTEKIKRAIEAYRNACRFFKKDEYPVQFSKISNNLGNLYRKLSVSENKKENAIESVKLLSSAVDSIETSSNEKFHAVILNNLGVSYCVLSEVMDSEANLLKACETFESAMALVPEEDHLLVSNIKNNLANSKCALYELTNEISHLDSSIEDYLSAMDNTGVDSAGTDNSILYNNYANSRLLKKESQVYSREKDEDFIIQNYNEALKNIDPELNPGVYSAVINNIACSNIHKYLHENNHSFLDVAIKSLEDSDTVLKSLDSGYLKFTLENNSGVADLLNFSVNADKGECEKAIEKFSRVYEFKANDRGPVTETLKTKALVNLLNALSLLDDRQSDENITDKLLATLNESLERFNIVNFPEVFGAVNFHIAKLYRKISAKNEDSSQLKLALDHYEKCLEVYSHESSFHERGLVNFEIGSISLSIYRTDGDRNYLDKSISTLKASAEVFNTEDFSIQNASIKLLLGEALLETGKHDKNTSTVFESINYLEEASACFNSKKYPEQSGSIKENLETAYGLLTDTEKSFDNVDEGIEYYGKLLEIFRLKDLNKDVAAIQIKLGKLYFESYKNNQKSERLEIANDLMAGAVDAIDKNSSPDIYYDALLTRAGICKILGETTGESSLINQNISLTSACLDYFNEDRDTKTFSSLCRQAGEAYKSLYEISDEISDLIESVGFLKKALMSSDQQSNDFNSFKGLYLESNRILSERFYDSSDFEKIVELVENEPELLAGECTDEKAANTALLAGKSYKELSEKEFNENYLNRSLINLQRAAGFFSRDQFPDKYYEIKNDILNNHKNLFSSSNDYKYLAESISIIDELIEFCDVNGKGEDRSKYLLDKADCTYLNARHEFDSGNYQKTVELCRQCLEFFNKDNYSAEYAHINQLMGMSYIEISSGDQLAENINNAVTHFNEAKIGFSSDETRFSEEIGFVNQHLEKAYKKLLDEDSQLDNQTRSDYLEKLVSLYKENERYEALPEAYKEIAECYLSIGEAGKNTEYLEKCINNFKNFTSYLDENEDATEIANSNRSMGFASFMIFTNSNDKSHLAGSIEYFEKANELYIKEDASEQIAELEELLFEKYCLYGDMYEKDGDIETALTFYEKAVYSPGVGELENKKLNQRLKNAALYAKIGEDNNRKEHFEKAVIILKDCDKNTENPENKTQIRIKLAEIFEKLYQIESNIDKLEKSITCYKEAVNSISDNDSLKNDIKSRLAKLVLQSAESFYDGNPDVSETRYLDALSHFSLEKDPENYAEINEKLADLAIEKFRASKNLDDGQKALDYLNCSSSVYTIENYPEHHEAVKTKIKSVFDSFIEFDLLSGKEKEECLYRLRDMVLNAGNRHEIVRYNTELAKIYCSATYQGEFDFDAFISDLKESEAIADSENNLLTPDIQYFLGKLYSIKANENDSDEFILESEACFSRFLNNPHTSADDERAEEAGKFLFELKLKQAELFREKGELEQSIGKFCDILENLDEENEAERFNDINFQLGELYLDLYKQNNDRSSLTESMNRLRKSKVFYLENNLHKQSEEAEKQLDEIFSLDLAHADSSGFVEKTEHLESLFAVYPENEYPAQFTELKKTLGLTLAGQYEIENNAELLYRAENILKEVLDDTCSDYPDEYLAEINMKLGELNLLIFKESEDRAKLETAQSCFQKIENLSSNEDTIHIARTKLDDVQEIVDSFTSQELQEAEDVDLIIDEEEVLSLDETEEVKDEVKDEEALYASNEKVLSQDNIQEVAEEITEEVSLDHVADSKEVNFVMKEVDQDNEDLKPDSSEKTSAESLQISEIKTELEKLDEKESTDEYIKLSLKLAEAYRIEAESGNLFNAYDLAYNTFRKTLSLVDKDNDLQLYAQISREIVSISYRLSADFDLRDYKQIIGLGNLALDYFKAADYPGEYGFINRDLGIIHTYLAEREGELKYYKNSINYYDEALKYLDKQKNPDDCAVVNKNMGVAYGIISEIEFDDRAFESSIRYYENSLETIDENRLPMEYALVNKYLGIAYGTYGERNDSIQYIEKSVVSYENALRYFTLDKNDSDYGLLNRNLGNNYLKLIESNNDPEFCNKGIDAYKRALEFYRMERTPFVYASINNNIGSLYSALSDLENKIENCEKAIDSYSKVLKVYNINDNPMEFAAANNNLGIAYRNLAEVRDKAENCEKAISCYEKALKAYTLKDFPIQYSNMQNNLGTAYRTLAEEKQKVENCKKSIKCYQEALKVRTIENMPIQFAGTQNNLGVAYRTLGEMESKMSNCKKAIEAYEAALFVYTLDKYPIQYATTKNNLAGAYSTLAESVDREKNYNNSIESYREAQKVFSENEFPDIYKMIEENIVFLQDNVEQ